MILKASQRGGANKLAIHLLNANDNEHVEVQEVSGFLSGSLKEALHEAYAISRGTKCKQFLFSVSLSPPKEEIVPIEVFEDVVKRIEKQLSLDGQARALVFHEKQGRRHAHVVWSRIDVEKMLAINLPYFKNRLMEISKELYLEHGWKLPQGFIDRENRNPLNFSIQQWYQANRLNESPRQIKTALKECWAISRSKKAFLKNLEQRGFYLAKGDRRGYVAVDWRGEVFSLSKWLDIKKPELEERLGEPKELPSIEDTRAAIDKKLIAQIRGCVQKINDRHKPRLAPLLAHKANLQNKHKKARQALTERQEERIREETAKRQDRLRKGFFGILDRLTGRHSRIRAQNEQEAYEAHARDRKERDDLIYSQVNEQNKLQSGISYLTGQRDKEIRDMKEKIFARLSGRDVENLLNELQEQSQASDHELSASMNM